MYPVVIKKVHFPNASGERLAGTLFSPKKPNGKGVLILHGFNGRHDSVNKLSWAYQLARLGFTALGFDFSGCGKSEGEFAKTGITKQVSDAESAMAFLKKEAQVGSFGLVGHSMGGVDSIVAASKRPDVFAIALLNAPMYFHQYPEKMVFMAGPTAFRDWAKKGKENPSTRVTLYDGESKVELEYAFKLDQAKYRLEQVGPKVLAPALVLHGSRDNVVEPSQAQVLANNLPKSQLVLIEGADHRLRQHTRQVNAALTKFFKQFA